MGPRLRDFIGCVILSSTTLLGCADEHDVPAASTAHVSGFEQPSTELASQRELLLENKPAVASVSMRLDALAGNATAEVQLTVVAPNDRRDATYDYGPLVCALEGREPLQLGVGTSQQDALVMYLIEPEDEALWAHVMAGSASLDLTRVHGTPEERVAGW